MRPIRSRRARGTLAAVGLFHGCLGLAFGQANPAAAQVVHDGSLGPRGGLAGEMMRVTPDRGRLVGSNLYHSFETFNVFAGQSVEFSGPAHVANVISRVT